MSMRASEIAQRHVEVIMREKAWDNEGVRLRDASLADTGRLAGDRFRRLDLPKRIRANMAGTTLRAELLAPDECARALRARTAIDNFTFSDVAPRRPEDVQIVPRPTRLLDLVEIVPVGESLVAPVSEPVPDTFDSALNGIAEFESLGDDDMSAEFTEDRLQLHRFGLAAPVANYILEDKASLGSVTIDRLLNRWFRLALEVSVLRDTGVELEKGITQNDAVVTTPFTTGTRAEAIGAIADAVGESGFLAGGITVAGRPKTLGRIFREIAPGSGDFLSVKEALPQVNAWVPTIGLPDGLVVIGDFSEVIVYIHGLDLELARNHKDYFLRGLTSCKLEARLNHWVRSPAAFQVVTGL